VEPAEQADAVAALVCNSTSILSLSTAGKLAAFASLAINDSAPLRIPLAPLRIPLAPPSLRLFLPHHDIKLALSLLKA